jgi:hypothetical protein
MTDNTYTDVLETHKRRTATPTVTAAPEPPGAALITAGVASLIAGLTHYAATGTHLPGETTAAVLFTVIGGFQIVWPALLGSIGLRPAALTGIAVNAVAVTVWALSRTTGLPFGHHAGTAQQVGLLDAAAVLAELVVVAAAVVTLRRTNPRPATEPRAETRS